MAKEELKDDRAAEAAEKTGTAQTVRRGQKPPQESVYSVDELAASAKKVFKTRQECVLAALKSAGKTECTVTEAREIVKKFLKEEVK